MIRQPQGSVARDWIESESPRPTGGGVKVCVIDSGWDYRIDGRNVGAGVTIRAEGNGRMVVEAGAQDYMMHGTQCTALLRLIAPQCQILPVRVFTRSFETSPEILCCAIEHAVENGARIINMSLATTQPGAAEMLSACCSKAAAAGTLIVASVDALSGAGWPAVLPDVCGVAPGTFLDRYAYAHCEGDDVEFIGRATWKRPGRPAVHASSYAAPQISAMAALILDRWPTCSRSEMMSHLVRLATWTRNGDIRCINIPPVTGARA